VADEDGALPDPTPQERRVPAANPPDPSKKSKDALAYGPLALTVAGLVMYAIGYASISRFYTELGATPGEVGVDYQGVLSKSLGLILCVVVSGILISLATWIAWRLRPRHRESLVTWVPVACAIALLLSAFAADALLGRAIQRRDQEVAAGRRVSPISVLGMSVMSLHADPVEVCSLAPGTTTLPKMGNKLLLLGSANGEAVIFDASSGKTIFVPLSAATLEIHPIHGS
jgi:hypothetical protein